MRAWLSANIIAFFSFTLLFPLLIENLCHSNPKINSYHHHRPPIENDSINSFDLHTYAHKPTMPYPPLSLPQPSPMPHPRFLLTLLPTPSFSLLPYSPIPAPNPPQGDDLLLTPCFPVEPLSCEVAWVEGAYCAPLEFLREWGKQNQGCSVLGRVWCVLLAVTGERGGEKG